MTLVVTCRAAASNPPVISESTHKRFGQILSLQSEQQDQADEIYAKYNRARKEIEDAFWLLAKWRGGLKVSKFNAYAPDLQSDHRRIVKQWEIDKLRLIRLEDDRYFDLLSQLEGVNQDHVESLRRKRFTRWRTGANSELPAIVIAVGVHLDITSIESEFNLSQNNLQDYQRLWSAYDKKIYQLAVLLDNALIKEINRDMSAFRNTSDERILIRSDVELRMNVVSAAIEIRKCNETFVLECISLIDSNSQSRFKTFCQELLDPVAQMLGQLRHLSIKAESLNGLTSEKKNTLATISNDIIEYTQRSTARLTSAHRIAMNKSHYNNYFETSAKWYIDYFSGVDIPPLSIEHPMSNWWILHNEVETFVAEKSKKLRQTLTSQQWRQIK